MKTQRIIFLLILLFVLLWSPTGVVTNGWSSEVVDHSLYDELLKKYVKNCVVDYQGFKNEEANRGKIKIKYLDYDWSLNSK